MTSIRETSSLPARSGGPSLAEEQARHLPGLPKTTSTQAPASVPPGRGLPAGRPRQGDNLLHLARTVFDCLLQSGQIVPKIIIFPENRPQKLKQGLEFTIRRIGQPMEDPESFPPIRHQAGVFEICEVARDVGLRHLEHVLDVAAAQLTVQKQVQNAEAVAVPQSLEARFEFCLPVSHSMSVHAYTIYVNPRSGEGSTPPPSHRWMDPHAPVAG